MENAEQAVEQTTEQAQQDDAAFEAGFNHVRGDELPAEIPPTEKVDQSASEVSAEVQNVEQPQAQKATEVDEPMVGGFKESEFKTLLAKAQRVDELEAQIKGNQDKVFGKFGEIQRLINEMKAAPAGQQIKITGEKLKRLSKEFPEMAEMLAEDLGELSMTPAQSTFDPSEIRQEFTRKQEESARDYEQKLLTIKHPEWKDTTKSEDFALWKGTLPANVKEQLENSWDSTFISQSLTAFSGWQSKSVKSTKERNDKRLAAAVTPSGTPNAGPTVIPDNAGLNAGFNKVRGK